MSGSLGNVLAISIPGQGVSSPWLTFVPTTWGTGTAGNAISSDLLMTQQLGIQQQAQASLATISNLGAYNFGQSAGLFNTWAGWLNNVNTISANALTTAVQKSASAPSGLLGSIFGF